MARVVDDVDAVVLSQKPVVAAEVIKGIGPRVLAPSPSSPFTHFLPGPADFVDLPV